MILKQRYELFKTQTGAPKMTFKAWLETRDIFKSHKNECRSCADIYEQYYE